MTALPGDDDLDLLRERYVGHARTPKQVHMEGWHLARLAAWMERLGYDESTVSPGALADFVFAHVEAGLEEFRIGQRMDAWHPTSIMDVVWAVGAAYRRSGLADPTAAPEVRDALLYARRTGGMAARNPRDALQDAETRALVRRAATAWRLTRPEMHDRAAALLRVWSDAGAVLHQVAQVELTSLTLSAGHATLWLPQLAGRQLPAVDGRTFETSDPYLVEVLGRLAAYDPADRRYLFDVRSPSRPNTRSVPVGSAKALVQLLAGQIRLAARRARIDQPIDFRGPLPPLVAARLLQGLNRDRLFQLRDRAYYLVCETMIGRGIDVERLDADGVVTLADGSFSVTVAGSKRDRERTVCIPHGQPCTDLCAACALKAWRAASGLRSGPLFRPVFQYRVGDSRLGASAMATRITMAGREACGTERAGRPARYGRHTPRRSAMRRARRRGLDTVDIALAANTTVDNVRRYTREEDAFLDQAHLDLSEGEPPEEIDDDPPTDSEPEVD